MNRKNSIDDYSIDYRNDINTQNFKSYEKVTKTVIASSPNVTKLGAKPVPKVTSSSTSKKNTVVSSLPKKDFKKAPVNDIYIPANSLKGIFYRAAFGCIVLLLSVAGLVIFISSLTRTAGTVSVTAPVMDNYSNFLAPVVMHDPLPFSCPEQADIQMVISSSIWRAISQNGTQKYNSFDEKGFSLIPVNDISSACYDLFGPKCTININEQIFGPFFSFTPGEEYFHICAISNQNSYIAYIKDSKEDPEFLILTVGYVSRDDAFFNSAPKKAPEPSPVKYMKYKLKTNEKNGNPYIFAVENVT